MTARPEPAKELEWFKKVKSWETSGKSAKSWCREHQVHYVLFLRWRRRFSNIVPKNFIELKERSQTHTGLSLECAGVTIHVSLDFEPDTLKKCLNVLRDGL